MTQSPGTDQLTNGPCPALGSRTPWEVLLKHVIALAPTPSQPPGRHWDPTQHPSMHIAPEHLACLGAFLLMCLALWVVMRVANGNWRPPSNGDGGWT